MLGTGVGEKGLRKLARGFVLVCTRLMFGNMEFIA